MAKIPTVKTGVISAMMVDVLGPQADADWVDNVYKQLQQHNPVIAEYVRQVRDKYGQNAAMVGLVIYRLIESQMEADELEELFSP